MDLDDILSHFIHNLREFINSYPGFSDLFSKPQIDPNFQTNRLYTRLSAAEVRRQLNLQKNYTDEELPTTETIRNKLNQLGYHPQKVSKSKPQKKIPETDEIFEQMERFTQEATKDPTTLQISMDAKAAVKIGPFSLLW